jgi:alkylation response protein AidB-like acyl-CoA dehydrogenase
MVGTAQKVLDMTVEHARTRRQFDRPIGTLQAVQHHCANLATCVETAELMTYRAGWLIEQGLPSSAEALKAKAWTNEACKRAAALGHQVHGGIGFMREYDLHLYSTRLTSFANSWEDPTGATNVLRLNCSGRHLPAITEPPVGSPAPNRECHYEIRSFLSRLGQAGDDPAPALRGALA